MKLAPPGLEKREETIHDLDMEEIFHDGEGSLECRV